MQLNKLILKFSLLIGLLCLLILILPTPQFLVTSKLYTTYLNTLFSNILIGILSSSILTAVISVINIQKAVSDLHEKIFSSMVEAHNMLYCFEQKSKLFLAISHFKPSYKDISLLTDIFNLSDSLQSLDISMKERELLCLNKKGNPKLFNFYYEVFNPLTMAAFTYSEDLNQSYTTFIHKLYGPRLSDEEAKQVLEQFHNNVVTNHKIFFDSTASYRKELNSFIKNSEQYGIKFYKTSFEP